MSSWRQCQPVCRWWYPGCLCFENIIRHGENGWYVPTGDADALAEALLKLCGDEPVRGQKIGAAARCWAQENLSFSRWQAQMAAFYGRLLASRCNRGLIRSRVCISDEE